MARYVYDRERDAMVDKVTGELMNDPAKRRNYLACPRVSGDIPDYRSPVTGEVISGRRAWRDDLKRHGCVDMNDFRPSGLRNERFARKHGIERLLE